MCNIPYITYNKDVYIKTLIEGSFHTNGTQNHILVKGVASRWISDSNIEENTCLNDYYFFWFSKPEVKMDTTNKSHFIVFQNVVRQGYKRL